MKRAIALAFLCALFLGTAEPAHSQAIVVTTCGTLPAAIGGTRTAGTRSDTFIDVNGQLCTNATGGGGGSSSSFNAAFPSTGTAAGLSDGTNMKAWLAAIALADGVNGNNTGAVAAWWWNGSTYDRAKGDSTNGLWVNVKNANTNGQATMANSSPVAFASDQTGIPISSAAVGGASTTGNIAANNTTAVVVKASAGTLYGAQLAGIGSAPAYLKIYNATSATCGSGTPVKRLMIPAAATAANGAGSNVSFGAAGIAFGTGITYCITTGIADNDATAPAASTFLVNLDWK